MRWPTKDRVRRYGNSVCGCELRRRATPRDWSVNGDLHAHLIEECARACRARASNCRCSSSCRSSPCCSLRSARLPPRRRSPARRRPRAKVGVWYNFQSRRFPTPTATHSGARSRTSRAGWCSTRRQCQLSAIPTSANVGTYSNISISVSDGTVDRIAAGILDHGDGSGASGTNQPPKISGTPPTTCEGRRLVQLPARRLPIPNGDTLTFSIQNKPSVGRVQPDPVPAVGRRRPARTSAPIRTSSSA